MYKKLVLEIGAMQGGMGAMHFHTHTHTYRHKSHRLVCQSTDMISHGYLKEEIKVVSKQECSRHAAH